MYIPCNDITHILGLHLVSLHRYNAFGTCTGPPRRCKVQPGPALYVPRISGDGPSPSRGGSAERGVGTGTLGAERKERAEEEILVLVNEQQPLFLPTPSFMALQNRRGVGCGDGLLLLFLFFSLVISLARVIFSWDRPGGQRGPATSNHRADKKRTACTSP